MGIVHFKKTKLPNKPNSKFQAAKHFFLSPEKNKTTVKTLKKSPSLLEVAKTNNTATQWAF